jgi:hypothetical protein
VLRRAKIILKNDKMDFLVFFFFQKALCFLRKAKGLLLELVSP